MILLAAPDRKFFEFYVKKRSLRREMVRYVYSPECLSGYPPGTNFIVLGYPKYDSFPLVVQEAQRRRFKSSRLPVT